MRWFPRICIPSGPGSTLHGRSFQTRGLEPPNQRTVPTPSTQEPPSTLRVGTCSIHFIRCVTMDSRQLGIPQCISPQPVSAYMYSGSSQTQEELLSRCVYGGKTGKTRSKLNLDLLTGLPRTSEQIGTTQTGSESTNKTTARKSRLVTRSALHEGSRGTAVFASQTVPRAFQGGCQSPAGGPCCSLSTPVCSSNIRNLLSSLGRDERSHTAMKTELSLRRRRRRRRSRLDERASERSDLHLLGGGGPTVAGVRVTQRLLGVEAQADVAAVGR